MLLPLVIVLLPLLSKAQNGCTFHIIRNAEEISKKPDNSEGIKSVDYSPTGGYIIVYAFDNKKIILQNSAVWGYQDKNCALYRNSGSHFLKVEQQGEMAVYSLQSKGFRNRVITSYYFSKGLNGPIYLLDGENLAEQYRDNTCFIKKLKKKFNSPFSQAYSERSRHSFTVIDLLLSCK